MSGPLLFLLVALIALAGSFVQSTTGFGYAVTCMALWPLLLPFKTATVVELGAKGEVRLNELPLSPLRPVRRLKGPLEALLQSAERSGDYIYAVLTDETPPLDAAARLRSVYPNLARLEFDLANRPARQAPGPDPATLARRTPADLFAEFYEQVHGRPLSQEEQAMLERALEREGQA